jgi:hypothetical protein
MIRVKTLRRMALGASLLASLGGGLWLGTRYGERRATGRL